MNEDMKIGAKIALEGVKEELIKVRAELKRKGYDNRRGFTTNEKKCKIKKIKGREGLTYNLKCYYSSMN